MKRHLYHISLILILTVLITNPKLSIHASAVGLSLWFDNVLPTLFPFMLCSRCIINSDGSDMLIFPFKKILKYIFGVSDSGCYAILIGLLCGFPMGAKTVSDFVFENKMTTYEGNYLLSICNHPSPIFLMGFLAPRLIPDIPFWVIPICAYLPMIPIGFFNRMFFLRYHAAYSFDQIKFHKYSNPVSLSFEDTFYECCKIMLIFGCYIMGFTILSHVFLSLYFLPLTVRCILSSISEMTSGIYTISSTIHNNYRNIFLIFTAVFGGVSGIFQTNSVIKKAGLNIKLYIIWKFIYSILSCFLYYILMH